MGCVASTDARSAVLDRRLAVHPQVSLRPEPFGALAYHYGNRKLVFLKNQEMVRVLGELRGDGTLADALDQCDIAPARWPSFETAMTRLLDSEMLVEVEHARAG